MLVILSDLHFGDGTATVENVPAGAFDLFLDHVLDLAKHARAPKITLLFLGDVFDLLRTEHWFHPAPGEALDGAAPPTAPGEDPFPLELRPWGAMARSRGEPTDRVLEARQACRARAIAIAEKIIATCDRQLRVLRGDPPPAGPDEDGELRARVSRRLAEAVTPIERLYLPGNHDRLARLFRRQVDDDGVMERLLAALGAREVTVDADGSVTPGCGVLARHGQEADSLNFDRRPSLSPLPAPGDYLRTPIGDPITTECMARLAYEVRADLLHWGIPNEVAEAVHDRLRVVEDVRPLGAALRWLTEVGAASWGQPRWDEEIERSLQRVASSLLPRMLDLPFSRRWARRPGLRRAWNVLQIRLVSFLSANLSLRTFARLLGLWDRLLRRFPAEDPYARAALGPLGGGAQRVVFGHTHGFVQLPLSAPAGGTERVYLNSGTWRHAVQETLDRSGFVGTKEMTYLVFYEAGERAAPERGGKAWEAWSGTMREGRR
jgi:UDP-2,3-diacylglucosamine pyrophosphatase LpxH